MKLVVSLNGLNFKTFVQFVKILKHGKTDPDANNPQMVKLEQISFIQDLGSFHKTSPHEI